MGDVVKVFRANPGSAEIGPRHTHAVGDRVTIPSADRGFPHRDHRPGFDGVVSRIDSDGVAMVIPVEAWEAQNASQ